MMKRLLLSTAFSLILCGGALANQETVSPRDQFYSALELASTDAAQGFAAMAAVAAAGEYPRAHDRLGYFNVKGVGVPVDLEAAVEHYKDAVDAGYQKSLISLGKLFIKLDRPEEALAALDRAAAEELKGGRAALAAAHASSGFGELSDPQTGWVELQALAQEGDRAARINTLYVAGRHGLTVDDPAPIVDGLLDLAEEGDTKAAETLLRYLRLSKTEGAASVSLRQKLLEMDGIRPRVAVEEGLYLALELTPGQFWTASEAVVTTTEDPDAFARGLSVTARINRNAYVRVLQMELRDLGYATGRASGYLNKRTISAINAFCREHGIKSDCVYGPLKSVAVKSIARELAAARS